MSESARMPVVFVHGLWLHAESWGPWMELFAAKGYAPTAPGWPGDADTVEETRANPDALAGRGIAVVTGHYARAIAELPEPPIVVGHSFGGLIAQKLLASGAARGCVAISPAQFRGIWTLPPQQLQSAWPILSRPSLRKKTWSHTPETFHRSFANAVPRADSDEIHRAHTIPAPGLPLFQAALANLSRHSEADLDARARRGPLLLIAGTEDRTVPEATVRSAHKIQSENPGTTEYLVLQGKGHSMPVDRGWREVADAALEFLARSGLSGASVNPRN